ncbi:aldehyde dehydrogenase family protein [Pararhodobacter zhoushanensis]|uniref:Aldehyde dehydrogenase family protein n=1 Tax=Pararhodobacter zhoushanensis TaxID=2479545 RepID=A0ABT3GV01_9RHOB|nr:aldehyde dehydrogenase family protein [Pararhodobacter zhoushanensis]MCW1931360.1 aldehyde dehydrogenase family protein [Pararhodobacter zhoushanensis]
MPTVPEALALMDYGPAPESPAIALDWLKDRAFGHFINGAFTKPGETFAVTNPASGAELAQVTQGTDDDVAEAVKSARAAAKGWAKLTGGQRARYLYALARLMQKRERLFAVLETLDNGKPIRESRDIDVPLAVRHFYHHAGWAELLADEFPGMRPHGVCGQIIPWNFPLLMLAWKVAPALAAGNTVVLKPAEFTPLTALLFAELCVEAGLPKGVVNIVTGDGRTGAALVAAEVDKIAFTGSTDVGRLIRRETAGSGKALTLELGGKSPFIVFAEADLDAAVEGVVDAIWFNQGEVCCAGSRILVQEQVAERFTARLKLRMAKLRLGDPLDKSTDIGAVVHPTQLERIRGLVDKAIAQGAILHQAPMPEGPGSFCPPGLLTDLGAANIAHTEEIFGPIVTLMTFRTPGEAVELANNTRYGLAASIWSENITTALDIAGQVKAGVVWINGTNMFDANAPFGGMRESGFGREGAREGMLAYLTGDEASGKERKAPEALSPLPGSATGDAVDRTRKLYIGGAQKRPDGGYSYAVPGAQVPMGSRKDIRNAVEAAHKASGWSKVTGHNRAQVLYFLAENIAARGKDLGPKDEVALAVERAFYWAAWADKYDGRVHSTASANITLALKEPFGVMGVICPEEAPLLGFVSTVLPAIAMGNRVVAVPSQSNPVPALDLYQVFDTSDLPGGVVNIVTGPRAELTDTLAKHDDVAALWVFAEPETCRLAETLSAGNLKPVWTEARQRDWSGPAGQSRSFLRRAVQVKTVWVPYGA